MGARTPRTFTFGPTRINGLSKPAAPSPNRSSPVAESASTRNRRARAIALFSGVGTPDPERSLAAVRDRLGPDPQKLIADHREALDALQFILRGRADMPDDISVYT